MDTISNIKEIIEIGISGILTLRNNFNSDLEKTINGIFKCKGQGCFNWYR